MILKMGKLLISIVAVIVAIVLFSGDQGIVPIASEQLNIRKAYYNVNYPNDTLVFETDTMGFTSNGRTKNQFSYFFSRKNDSINVNPFYGMNYWFSVKSNQDSLVLEKDEKILIYKPLTLIRKSDLCGDWNGKVVKHFYLETTLDYPEIENQDYYLSIEKSLLKMVVNDTIRYQFDYNISADNSFVYNMNNPSIAFSFKLRNDTLVFNRLGSFNWSYEFYSCRNK
jgi:hypothetical protein